MIRSILKQLWNERKSNGWIFIEILVIAVIAWFSFDTIYVIKYQESIPLGFDKENIYILNTSTLKEGNLYYDASRADTAALLDDYDRLRRLINDHPLISSAYITQRWGIPLTGSSNWGNVKRDTSAQSTQVQLFYYQWNDPCFETLGIPLLQGSQQDVGVNEYVIPQNLSKSIFADESPLNKQILDQDENVQTVRAETGPVKNVSTMQPNYVCFIAREFCEDPKYIRQNKFVIKVKEHVTENQLADLFSSHSLNEMRQGNVFIAYVESYDEIIRSSTRFHGGMDMNAKTIVFLFLLINVFLSIIGTFWLRINRKKEEIGIRMAMGSSRLKIQLYFISESLVLISAALIPALLIVLQVLYFKGLFVFAQVKAVAGSFPAVNNPVLHFCVVSLLIWLFFLLIGIIGTSFPAWHASRVNPIDALRDQ